jgi:pimeloyl-ACP methyl ester carboxylesterase
MPTTSAQPPEQDLTGQTIRLSTGRQLGFAEFGDPKGTPCLYYHGWPSSRLQGELMHGIGLAKGLRIIAPDRPGIGLSTEQPNRTLLDWPPVLGELLAHLGIDRFYVMGISGGGPYVLATVYAMPERILGAGILCGAPELRIVGTSDLMWTYKTALFAKKWFPWTLGPGLAMAAWFLGRPNDQWPMNGFIKSLCAEDQRALMDPKRYRIITDSCLECLKSPTSAVKADGDIYSSDWGFDLGQIKVPLHLWHGEADKNIPFSSAQRMAALIPTSRTRWFKDDGHYSLPMLRSEELVEAMLAEGHA